MLLINKTIVEKVLGNHASSARCWGPMAIAVAAVAMLLPARSHADKGNDESLSTGAKAVAIESAVAANPDFESKFLALLSAGKQSEAEELIAAEVARYPKALELVKLVERQKNEEARDYKLQNLAEILPAQLRLVPACRLHAQSI